MHAFVFPGQASQFPGMGKDLYNDFDLAKKHFEQANEILGYRLSDIMFDGSEEDLKETRITQPAVFLYSYIKRIIHEDIFKPDVVAGHSLGEFTALTAVGSLNFEDGLNLVQLRADSMQQACESVPGTMAAIVGLEDKVIEDVCNDIDAVVVPANYNCPGQLVISGSVEGIEEAVKILQEKGARRAIVLSVGGAFHSPLMKPAEAALSERIKSLKFNQPSCPIYQNVSGTATTNVEEIKENLILQLTSPVKWTQTMHKMLEDGVVQFTEMGAKVLCGFVKRIDRKIPTEAL